MSEKTHDVGKESSRQETELKIRDQLSHLRQQLKELEDKRDESQYYTYFLCWKRSNDVILTNPLIYPKWKWRWSKYE